MRLSKRRRSRPQALRIGSCSVAQGPQVSQRIGKGKRFVGDRFSFGSSGWSERRWRQARYSWPTVAAALLSRPTEALLRRIPASIEGRPIMVTKDSHAEKGREEPGAHP